MTAVSGACALTARAVAGLWMITARERSAMRFSMGYWKYRLSEADPARNCQSSPANPRFQAP